jgi:hypothetical protein
VLQGWHTSQRGPRHLHRSRFGKTAEAHLRVNIGTGDNARWRLPARLVANCLVAEDPQVDNGVQRFVSGSQLKSISPIPPIMVQPCYTRITEAS